MSVIQDKLIAVVRAQFEQQYHEPCLCAPWRILRTLRAYRIMSPTIDADDMLLILDTLYDDHITLKGKGKRKE